MLVHCTNAAYPERAPSFRVAGVHCGSGSETIATSARSHTIGGVREESEAYVLKMSSSMLMIPTSTCTVVRGTLLDGLAATDQPSYEMEQRTRVLFEAE